mmetsp:Transcript_31461/g.90897  ORF Transcript_31461/g.90897 Transcript_31461/m.90897 type:complete len:383 (+) Transcript_31461:240-1388(+)
MLRYACTSSAKCALRRWCSNSSTPAFSSSMVPPAIGPSSSMARCTPDGVCALKNASASSYLFFRTKFWNLKPFATDVSSRRCLDCPSAGAELSPAPSSAPKGAAKRGVRPSSAVGRKNGALGSGFGGSAALLRSLTTSRCNVAIHFAGGTSDSVSRLGSRGTVLVEGAGFLPSSSSSDAPSSASAGTASSSSPSAPGSSTFIGALGSGRNSGADREGSNKNLFAHTWMALPLACDVRRKAPLGEKHKLKAGLAKTKESTHRAANKSKTRRPPSRRAAASQRPSELKATSVAGTPHENERTTDAPFRSTTKSAPLSKGAATNAPCIRSRTPLGWPAPEVCKGTEKAGSCVMSFQVRSTQSRGCDAKEITSPDTEISTPQTLPW